MLMSTTDRIPGYRIKALIGIGYGIGKAYYYEDAMDKALQKIQEKHKGIPNIGVVGLHHSVTCDEDEDSVITIMGTFVMLETE